MTIEEACKILGTKPTRSTEFLKNHAEAYQRSCIAGQTPIRYRVAITVLLSIPNHSI